ncbi:MAG: ArsR family transcriptional regulator [Promethearchaeota archaeon]|nr:MAG: ArsR family transcriptional regulator [Candidatus Lokiarchaeota archaeon]
MLEEREDKFYSALGHDLRRKMIIAIGEDECSSFTRLKKALNVSTGTIYHHLDALSELIEQKEDKKYYLTDLGLLAFNYLQDNKVLINPSEGIKKYKVSKFMDPVLNPSNKRENTYSIIFSLICLTIGFIFAELNHTFSILLFFISSRELTLPLLFGITFIANFIVLGLIVELILRYILDKKVGDFWRFLRTFAAIFFPLTIYLIIHYVFISTNFITLSIVFFIDRIILIIFQGLSVWILAYDLTINKDLRMENGLIFALILHLSSFIIITTFLSF